MAEDERSKRAEEAIKRIKKNPDVVRPSIGLFAGIYDRSGRVLLVRRSLEETLPGDWDLPGGAVETEATDNALNERLVGQELAREVKEETGLIIIVDPMPVMYPAIIAGGFDWAFVVPVPLVDLQKFYQGAKENMEFVSPEELYKFAQHPEGNRLVSGVGKRMHRLALMALCHSPNSYYEKEAKKMLQEIHNQW